MYTSGISLGERGQLDASLSNINNPSSSPSVTPSAAGTMAPNKESTASGSKGGDRQQSVEPGEAQADALRDDPNTIQRIKVRELLTSNLNFGLDVMSVVCNGSKSAARRVLSNEPKEFLPSRFVHACNRVLANVHPMQATVEEHLLALGMEGVAERQTGILKRLEQVEENSLPSTPSPSSWATSPAPCASTTEIRAPTYVSWSTCLPQLRTWSAGWPI